MTLLANSSLRGAVLSTTDAFSRAGSGSKQIDNATPWQSALIHVEELAGYTCRGMATGSHVVGGADMDLPLLDQYGRPLGMTEWLAPGFYWIDLRGIARFRFRAASGSHGYNLTYTLSADPSPLAAPTDVRQESHLITLGDASAIQSFTISDVSKYRSAVFELTIPSDSPNVDQFRVRFRREAKLTNSRQYTLPIYREDGIWHDYVWARETGRFMIDLNNVDRLLITSESGSFATVFLTLLDTPMIPRPLSDAVGQRRSTIVNAGETKTGHWAGFQVIESAVMGPNCLFTRRPGEQVATRYRQNSPHELPVGFYEPGAFDQIQITSGTVRVFDR